MRIDEFPDADADEFGRRLGSELQAPVPLSDRVEQRVLARLRQPGPAGRTERRPRHRQILAGAALAAGVALVFGLGVLTGRRTAPGVPAEPALAASQPDVRVVEFALRIAADSAVTLVGDFNDWDPRATPLRPASDGLWTVTLPLRPGRYRYTFIVDGTRWRRDPAAPRALEDDFGTPTSVITVASR